MTKRHLDTSPDIRLVETDPVDTHERRGVLEERARIGARLLGVEDASLSAMAARLDALPTRDRDAAKE